MDTRLHDVTGVALIFDMDGLLVDTEQLYFEATEQIVAEYGHRVRVSDYADWVGREVTYQDFQRLFPCDLPEESLWQRLRETYHRLCETKLTLRPGVLEFLDGPAADYPKAVASSTRRETIEHHLAQVGLRERFAVVVSAREVARGKPAPDVFLEAARRLGVEPARCVVFEDSPHGVNGAKAAGMRVVAVPTEFTAHLDFSRADRVVDRLDAIPAGWLRGTSPDR